MRKTSTQTKSISYQLPLGRKMATKRLFNLVMLMFLVSVIEKESMVKVVEGRLCWTPSQTFHGICMRNKNCAAVCEQEGFIAGQCKGMIKRRCMCASECGGGGGGGDYPPPSPYEEPGSS